MLGSGARRLLAPIVAVTALSTTLGGCGDARPQVPAPSRPQSPAGTQTVGLDGVVLSVPANWTLTRESGALGAVATSGPAVIALWRFPRPGAAPAGAAEIDAARRSLLATVRRRDPAIRVLGTNLGRIAGAPSIGIDAVERIDGLLCRVLSVHILRAGSDTVLDEYAPVWRFAAVERLVFTPVLHALRQSPSGRV